MIPTQTEIVLRLAELSRMLDAATVEVRERDEACALTRSAYERAYATAIIASEGPADVRKAQATLDAADAKYALELAEVQHRACRERINTIRSQLSIGQTLSAAVRTQFAAEGTGQFT